MQYCSLNCALCTIRPEGRKCVEFAIANGLSKNYPRKYWMTDRNPNRIRTFSDVQNFCPCPCRGGGDVTHGRRHRGDGGDVSPPPQVLNSGGMSPQKSCFFRKVSEFIPFFRFFSTSKIKWAKSEEKFGGTIPPFGIRSPVETSWWRPWVYATSAYWLI